MTETTMHKLKKVNSIYTFELNQSLVRTVKVKFDVTFPFVSEQTLQEFEKTFDKVFNKYISWALHSNPRKTIEDLSGLFRKTLIDLDNHWAEDFRTKNAAYERACRGAQELNSKLELSQDQETFDEIINLFRFIIDNDITVSQW